MAKRKTRSRTSKPLIERSSGKRAKIPQTEFPRYTLQQVLRIPRALWDEFAGKDAAPHDLAIALQLTPTSGGWRNLCGASIAYGLTEGGYNATTIELTELGRRAVAPLDEGDDAAARVDAVMQPRIMREFFTRYDRRKFPSDTIARSVLVELGLPRDRAAKAVDILKTNGRETGIFRDTKTGLFVALDRPTTYVASSARDGADADATEQKTAEPPSPVSTHIPPVRTRSDSAPSHPVTPTRPLARGAVVDAYKLRQRLGAGFSAEVWSATVQRTPPGVDLQKGDAVAIKFYHAHAMALPDQVLRVEREYRIAQSLRHPHLIRIYEFLLASPRPHHNFLVMDVAKGKPLSEWIRSGGLTSGQALTVFYQILSALDALHGAGALHRDVKPGNVSLEIQDDRVHAVLLDLGIVTVTYEKGVTAVSHFLGSKHWAPIEQLLGNALDERSDLYGIGAVVYNALTRQEPYSSCVTEAAVAVEMSRSPLSLPSVADVPIDVTDMINACLSHRQEGRPRSARDCLDVLERHLGKQVATPVTSQPA